LPQKKQQHTAIQQFNTIQRASANVNEAPQCPYLYNMTIMYKKLIRRWDSEREHSLRQHRSRTRTTKYN